MDDKVEVTITIPSIDRDSVMMIQETLWSLAHHYSIDVRPVDETDYTNQHAFFQDQERAEADRLAVQKLREKLHAEPAKKYNLGAYHGKDAPLDPTLEN